MMLSNLGSTSSSSEVLGATTHVAYWNIMCDDDKRFPSQASRIPDISNQILSINDGQGPDILYMCEGADPESIQKIANLACMQIVGEPQHYSSHETMAFVAKASVAEHAEVTYVKCGNRRSYPYGFLVMTGQDETLIGLHNPHRIVFDAPSRNYINNSLLDVAKTADTPRVLLAGDFNMQPNSRLRENLLNEGFTNLFAQHPPIYPTPGFETVGTLRFIPKFIRERYHLSLDGGYGKGFKDIHACALPTTLSDHVLLEFRYPKTADTSAVQNENEAIAG